MHSLNPVPRFLRKVTLCAFPASALFFIFASFACYSPFPLLSLAIVALSSAHALFILYHDTSERQSSPERSSYSRRKNKLARKDCLLAIAHFIALLITYLRMFNGWHGDADLILSTYCTAFIIVDLAIHIYFCAHSFKSFIFSKMCSCDDCQGPPAYTQQTQRPSSAPRHASPGGRTERKTIIEFDTDDETNN
mgnify:FL=1